MAHGRPSSGISTSDPVKQVRIAFVAHEPEGTYRIRPSLTHDRAGERQLAVEPRAGIKAGLLLQDLLILPLRRSMSPERWDLSGVRITLIFSSGLHRVGRAVPAFFRQFIIRAVE